MIPRWGSHHQGHRHRQRHDQLRPRQDGLDRGGVRRDRRGRPVPGYAEADPTADVEGFDVAAKAAILALLGLPHSCRHPPGPSRGITEVTAAGHRRSRRDGRGRQTAGDLRAGELSRGEAVSVRVHPAMIPRTHPLGSVRDAFNAVFVEADAAGELMFYGRGAAATPTASAIPGDVVEVARHPRQRRAWGRRVRLRRPACSADGCRVDQVPHQPRRRRSTGGARGRGGDLRRARRVDRDRSTTARRPGSPAMAVARPLSS